METLLKQLIKEAVIEALNEFANAGVAVASGDGLLPMEPNPEEVGDGVGEGTGNNNNNNNNNNNGNSGSGNSGANSGGDLNDGRPKPNTGVGVWSNR